MVAGFSTNVQEAMRTMIAAAGALQTGSGDANATDAKVFMHSDGFLARATGGPMAIADMPIDTSPVVGGWTRIFTVPAGTVDVRFEDDVASEDAASHENTGVSFRDNLDAVLADMRAVAGSSGYLDARMVPTDASERDERDEVVDFMQETTSWKLGPQA